MSWQGETSMEIDTGTTELLCSLQDGVALITLNRPEARNALSDRLTPALRTQIKERGDDPEVGAILITGAGTAFCSGGDVKGMGGRGPRGQMSFEERLSDLRRRQAALTGALVALRKPTIAALPGPAAGAGLAIALACDIRIAAKSAFVSTGYARVGRSGRLRHRLAAHPCRRLGAGARADVHRRARRCRALRAHRAGQPRGRRRQARRRGVCAGEVAGPRAARGLAQHEGQSRRCAFHRLSDGALSRGRAAGAGLAYG